MKCHKIGICFWPWSIAMITIKMILKTIILTIITKVIAIFKTSNNKRKSMRTLADWNKLLSYNFYYQNHLQLLYSTVLTTIHHLKVSVKKVHL